MLPLLIEAARVMDEVFWVQAYGDRDAFLASIADPDVRRYAQVSYGPWDAVRANEPFVPGAGPKPPGANLYPLDMTKEEFEAAAVTRPDLKSAYTMVRRGDKGELVAIPYHSFFREQSQSASDKLRQAAALAEEPGLKEFLTRRAEALLTDEYRPSDSAWMDMKASTVDILIGPMETSADRLMWTKAAHTGTILIKDWPWSERLARYIQLLPRFQDTLPVPDVYKRDRPGLGSDVGVYDVLYCAGYDRASIPMGVNWPDDEEIRLRKGTRSLQLRNVMRAKFEKILMPMVDLLIAEDQRPYVTFDGFFTFVLFHEIGHGLGIKTTITGKGLVREALREYDYVIEEAKADLLSLWMVGRLHEWGDLSESELRQVYVTALADIFRRNGHSRQVMMRLNYFRELGAYSRDAESGMYRVHLDRLPAAINALAERLLRFQGDGDYDGAKEFLEHYAQPDDAAKRDLDQVAAAGLPLEVAVEQETK